MRFNTKRLLACLSVFIFFCTFNSIPLLASDHAGVVAIAVDAYLEGDDELNSNDDIDEGDVLITGPEGSLIVLFNDESILMLGANAHAKLVSYSEGDIKLTGHSEIKILAGRFNFLPGQILDLGGIQKVSNQHNIVKNYHVTATEQIFNQENLATGNKQKKLAEGLAKGQRGQPITKQATIKQTLITKKNKDAGLDIASSNESDMKFISGGSTATPQFVFGAIVAVPQSIEPFLPRTAPVDTSIATDVAVIEIEPIEIESFEFEPIEVAEIEAFEFEPIEVAEIEPIEIEPIEIAEIEPIEIEPVEIEN